MSAPDVLAVLRSAVADAVMARAARYKPEYAAQLEREGFAACAAVAELLHYGRKIEQRRRGVLHGDADTEAQDWAEFRSALARCGGAP